MTLGSVAKGSGSRLSRGAGDKDEADASSTVANGPRRARARVRQDAPATLLPGWHGCTVRRHSLKYPKEASKILARGRGSKKWVILSAEIGTGSV